MLPELPFGLTVVDVVSLGLTIATLIMLVRLSNNLKKHRSLEHSTPSLSSVAETLRAQAEKPDHIRESGEPSKELKTISRAKEVGRKEPSPSSPEDTMPRTSARKPEHTIHSTLRSSAKPVPAPENVKTSKGPEKKIVKPEASKEKKPSSDSTKCPHYFGYLKSLPDRGSVPDYCYECPSIMRCLFATEEQIARAQA